MEQVTTSYLDRRIDAKQREIMELDKQLRAAIQDRNALEDARYRLSAEGIKIHV